MKFSRTKYWKTGSDEEIGVSDVEYSFKDLLLLVYGLADMHKPLHTLALHNEMFLMHRTLEKRAT